MTADSRTPEGIPDDDALDLYFDGQRRLTYENESIRKDAYPGACAHLAALFSLTARGEKIDEAGELAQDYGDGEAVVGLEWDNSAGFCVVAKNPPGEALVRAIGAYLHSGEK